MGKVDVSIIVTCYNKEKYLPELLDSISKQTRKPNELIVIHDDCKEISTYEGITTVFQRPNSGVAKCRDIGFRMSHSPLVLFLDGDDVINPDFLEKATVKMARGFDVVYSDVLLWYEHGTIDYGIDNELQWKGEIKPKDMMHFNQLIVSCLMKREVYMKVGGFANLPIYEDYDFWMRVMATNSFKFGKFESLFWYRQYPGSRNRQDKSLRQKVHKQIADQYKIVKNKLVRI